MKNLKDYLEHQSDDSPNEIPDAYDADGNLTVN